MCETIGEMKKDFLNSLKQLAIEQNEIIQKIIETKFQFIKNTPINYKDTKTKLREILDQKYIEETKPDREINQEKQVYKLIKSISKSKISIENLLRPKSVYTMDPKVKMQKEKQDKQEKKIEIKNKLHKSKSMIGKLILFPEDKFKIESYSKKLARFN